MGGWPVGYLQGVELNSGPPKTNLSSGREEDFNSGPKDYKSSALPLGHARLPHKQAKLASMRNCTGDKTCITVYVTICYRKDKVGLEIFALCAFLITIAVFYLIPY